MAKSKGRNERIAERSTDAAFSKSSRGLLWLATALSFAACSSEGAETAGASGSLGAGVDAGEPVEDEETAADEDEDEESAEGASDPSTTLPDVGGPPRVSTATEAPSRAESTTNDACPKEAPDRDQDGLCDPAEARLGTDPGKPDSDGDSLSDGAEVNGMLVHGAGVGGAPALLDLRAAGANPLHRDLFVEIDYYAGLAPNAEVRRMLQEAFANAPVRNPDGKTGITLHLLVDDEITGHLALPTLGDAGTIDESPDAFPQDVWRDFKKIKDAYADPTRHAAYHYALFAHSIREGTGTGVSFQIKGHDFAVTLGHADHPSDLMVAGTFMHELGHNLGLHHGGTRHIDLAPNYLSVMNYLYQNKGLVRRTRPKTRATVLYHEEDTPLEDGYEAFIDYSRFRLQEISEWMYAESTGLAPVRESDRAALADYGIRRCLARGMVWYDPTRGVDFDLDGDISSEVFERDLNCDSRGEVFPASQNDWDVLVFDGAGSIGNPDSWKRYRSGAYDAVTYGPCEPPPETEQP